MPGAALAALRHHQARRCRIDGDQVADPEPHGLARSRAGLAEHVGQQPERVIEGVAFRDPLLRLRLVLDHDVVRFGGVRQRLQPAAPDVDAGLVRQRQRRAQRSS